MCIGGGGGAGGTGSNRGGGGAIGGGLAYGTFTVTPGETLTVQNVLVLVDLRTTSNSATAKLLRRL